jgi:hypothetical protein
MTPKLSKSTSVAISALPMLKTCSSKNNYGAIPYKTARLPPTGLRIDRPTEKQKFWNIKTIDDFIQRLAAVVAHHVAVHQQCSRDRGRTPTTSAQDQGVDPVLLTGVAYVAVGCPQRGEFLPSKPV